MSWDPAWDAFFRNYEYRKYPSEDLIRFVAQSFYPAPDRRQVRILDVGCGPGGNAWYLAREGFAVSCIDRSEVAIERTRQRMREEDLTAEFRLGDLVEIADLYEPESFDAAVDVMSIQHNRIAAVRRILDGIWQVLKPGGKMFSMLIAEGTWGDGQGTEVEPGTFADIPDGLFRETGLVHFFGREETALLFSRFEDVELDYTERARDNLEHRYRHWVVHGTKPR
jgi:SAM-dependent methyltransferase